MCERICICKNMCMAIHEEGVGMCEREYMFVCV